MTHSRKNLVLVGSVAALGLFLAGCGASPSAPAGDDAGESRYAEFDAMPDGDRQDALVEAAEGEGEVSVYLRSDVVFNELEKAFEAEYDIDLVLLNPGTTQVVQQQIFEQASAGQVEADVVETYTHELNLMYADEKVAAPMPKFLAEAAPDPSLASEYGIETFQYPFLPAWNSDVVSGSDAPTSMKDFTGEVWKDRTVLVSNYHPWYLTQFQQLTQNEGMSVEDFEALFTEIAANSSTADSSNPASAGIASGEYSGGPNLALTAIQKLGAGAPIGFEPTTEPASLVPVGLGLLAQAKHPAAAMLFTQWYLNEGSDILVDEQFIEQNPNESDLQGVEMVRPDTRDLTTERLDEWRVAYDNLLKGKETILPEYITEE